MPEGQQLKILRKTLKLSQGEFAEAIGLQQGSYSDIERERIGLSYAVLKKVYEVYRVSPAWIMDGFGEMMLEIKGKTINTAGRVPVNEKFIAANKESPYAENKYKEPLAVIKPVDRTVFVNEKNGSEIVPIVDISVAAGGGYINEEYAETMEAIHLPDRLLKKGMHRCVRVRGESMAPTLIDGGFILIRYKEKSEWLELRDEHVFVVIDMDGHAYVKRVKNRLREQEFITLMSDNPDKVTFPNIHMNLPEIAHIWDVEWYFTAKMQNIHDSYYARLQRIEDRLDEVNRLLTSKN